MSVDHTNTIFIIQCICALYTQHTGSTIQPPPPSSSTLLPKDSFMYHKQSIDPYNVESISIFGVSVYVPVCRPIEIYCLYYRNFVINISCALQHRAPMCSNFQFKTFRLFFSSIYVSCVYFSSFLSVFMGFALPTFAGAQKIHIMHRHR